jgi:hypothetical protein
MASPLEPHELALHNRYESELVTQDTHVLALAGQVANEQAVQDVFADYLSRKADNTIRRQAADLARFAAFLDQAGEGVGLQLGAALAAFAESVAAFPQSQGRSTHRHRHV